ncbi:MAG: DMT family transporter [Paraburkholderia tropica]|uniref:Drug/metabolite transporter (DMT)-like permease n=2 Tax=Burkholderiaceae TaxID=119060 RepID=A0ABX5MIP9_9BURK|nr:DMT family transporter [Paraburkholderia tropica]MDE1141333.1 DMT family transporter [Paraburkholderia tropica]PXX12448.1 drug/metabolite transporter (DMT)-like permease [Paraburkholderia tropica]PZW76425.1 drug/metabolite transporter (DMT)-like permease [Paraburkholderia tropica]
MSAAWLTARNLKSGWPTLAIMIGASVWGVIWFPLRTLASFGLTGTAAGAATSAAACLFVLLLRRRSISTVRWHWVLPLLGLAAGVTNIGFVWGAIHGEVMRVLLLFYLTPAWTAIFAHFILHERLTWSGAALAGLSLAGAVLMLWSPRLGVPLPGSAAEWAGLAGGMGFAMSNVLVVKTSRVLPQMKPEMRTAVIFGGAAIFGVIASFFEPMPALHAGEPLARAVLLVLALGVLLGVNNMLVQYGLARVPANRASIIMLFEIVVTALSSWLLAGETPGPREWAGGACIVLASLLSSWVHRAQEARKRPRQVAHASAEASAIAHADASLLDDETRGETSGEISAEGRDDAGASSDQHDYDRRHDESDANVDPTADKGADKTRNHHDGRGARPDGGQNGTRAMV